MDASNIKRQALYLVIGALGCVLVWKIAPLLSTSGSVSGAPRRRECDTGSARASGFGAGERQYGRVRP